jgi:hypothetical protein
LSEKEAQQRLCLTSLNIFERWLLAWMPVQRSEADALPIFLLLHASAFFFLLAASILRAVRHSSGKLERYTLPTFITGVL